MISTSYNALHNSNHHKSRKDHDYVDVDYILDAEDFLMLIERLEEYKHLFNIEFRNCEDADSFVHFNEYDRERVCIIKLREDPSRIMTVYLEEAENKFSESTRYRIYADVNDEKHLKFDDKYEQGDAFDVLWSGLDNEDYARAKRLITC